MCDSKAKINWFYFKGRGRCFDGGGGGMGTKVFFRTYKVLTEYKINECFDFRKTFITSHFCSPFRENRSESLSGKEKMNLIGFDSLTEDELGKQTVFLEFLAQLILINHSMTEIRRWHERLMESERNIVISFTWLTTNQSIIRFSFNFFFKSKALYLYIMRCHDFQ